MLGTCADTVRDYLLRTNVQMGGCNGERMYQIELTHKIGRSYFQQTTLSPLQQQTASHRDSRPRLSSPERTAQTR